MTRKALIAAISVALAGCTVSQNDARFVVEAMGMRDVKFGGPSLFGCSDKDTFTRVFTATDSAGRRVKGAVCKGWLKGATVRISGEIK